MSDTAELVERVAPIVARTLAKRNGLADHRSCDAWLSEAKVATRATLEASHHAELVEALRQIVVIPTKEWSIDTAHSIARRALAEIGGDA